MADKSGIENFFDVGGQSQIDANDPLSWENVSNRQVNVDGNELVDRKPGGSPDFANQTGSSYSASSTGRIDCLKAADCGSGFVCVDGACVLNGTANQSNGGGSTTTGCNDGGTPTIPETPDIDGCYSGGPTCIDFTGPGSCEATLPNFELDCCGKTKHRCCFEGDCWDQCFPCLTIDFPDFPPIPPIPMPDPDFPKPPIPSPDLPTPPNPTFPPASSGCSSYGDANQGNFGGGGGCSSECAECFNGSCVSKSPAFAPCQCGGGCGNCESCSDSGSCELDEGCRVSCNCFYTCPDGQTLRGNSSTAAFNYTGLACPNKCRNELASQCKDPVPQKDPCLDDPNNPCDSGCRCLSREKPCGGPTPCNPGQVCTSFGGGSVGSKCFEIVRECNAPAQDCDPDNCNNTGCGEGQLCGGGGKCEDDPGFDNLPECEGEVCGDGTCCPGGCVPGTRFEIIDTCHGLSFTAVASAQPQLVQTAVIPAAGAVCSRYHTHCNVVSPCGGVLGVHYDCQAGIQGGGGSSISVCGAC